ncbi:MAG: aspartate/tyrosine/aromatic aminotransferase [Gammaproteobacteria bacterium]|nr:aspartate/tyrosine/aromatic aminotransferase [Gammaproteobacteria bacterium]
MFEKLQAMPADAILKLIAEYASDGRADKIDLGVGVYRDESGATPVLQTVKKAERFLLETQDSKSYLGSGGSPAFNAAITDLIFGAGASNNPRITTLQTPGGSGSLRVAAGVVKRASPDAVILAGEPTWANHVPLLSSAGIDMQTFPFYDGKSHRIDFDRMLSAVEQAPAGSVLLLHGCCHNPTGMDLSDEQWRAMTDVVVRRSVVPFIDIAYQGFATGLDEDAYGVRHMLEVVPEMIVSGSCSKNFALYRDRVGSLSFVARDEATAQVLRSQANNIVRTMYSMPPDHGAATVSHILADPALRQEWQRELDGMRQRLGDMRALLGAALRDKAPAADFSHIERANGMFCFLGVTPEQVKKLKSDFGVYMVGSSRINVAGITSGNVGHLADSIAAVI